MSKKLSKSHNTESSEHDNADQDHLGLDRLVFFSDGVFAIAITLLVLEIRLPSGPISDDAQLLASLLDNMHKYLAYIISFLVIGSLWSSHHRKFRFIRRYDGRLLTLNLLFLMVVAFMPFPSAVISEISNRTATIFYALIMMVAAFWMTVMWGYASHDNRLTDSHLDSQTRRRELIRPFLTALVFLLSIGVAFLNPDLARLVWLFVIPAATYTLPRKNLAS